MSIRSRSWSRFRKSVFLWFAVVSAFFRKSVFLWFFVVLALWLVTPVLVGFWIAKGFVVSWVPSYSPSKGGEFGDQFGALNALFTGLAFAGAVWAIYHQRGQSDAQNVAALTMYLMDPERRRKRGMVRSLLKRLEDKPQKDAKSTWRKEWGDDATAVGDVCGQFNHAGLLIKSGAVPREYLTELTDLPRRVYGLVASDTTFLTDMRKRDTGRFGYFEWLVKELKRKNLGDGPFADYEELAADDATAPKVDVRVRIEPVRVELVRDPPSGIVAVGLVAATLLYAWYTHRPRGE